MGKSIQVDFINQMADLPVKAESPTYLEMPAPKMAEPTRDDYGAGMTMQGKTDVNTPTGSSGIVPNKNTTAMRNIFNSPPISGSVSFGQQDTSKSFVWIIAAIALLVFVYKRK